MQMLSIPLLLALVAAFSKTAPSTREVVPSRRPASSRSAGPGEESLASRLRALEKELDHSEAATRRRVVRELAGLDQPAAWKLLLSALEDTDGQVADEAQLALAAVHDVRSLELLFGREGLGSQQEWVRLRIAEALGRMPTAPPLRELLGAIEARDVETCRALLWSIERLALAGRLQDDRDKARKALEACLARRYDERVRASATSALAALSGEGALPALRELQGDRSALVRCARVAALARIDAGAQRAALLLALADESACVRLQALDSLLVVANKEVLAALVSRLEREPSRRVRARLAAGLRRVTGMKYRTDPRPWQRYLSGLAPDWVGLRSPPSEAPVPEGSSQAKLAGMPLTSDRLAFLIDFSGSTWGQRVGNRTRKEVLDEKVREALGSLPEQAHFNLIPYTAKPIPWREQLTQARKREVLDALDFFEDCKARGPGNVFDALRLAMQDPTVETIVLLSDGAPSGGRRWNLGLMVELIHEENRYRKLEIDVLLVDAPGRLHRYWQQVADQSGGLCMEASLDGK